MAYGLDGVFLSFGLYPFMAENVEFSYASVGYRCE